MKQDYKNKIFVLGLAAFGLINVAIFANPAKVFAGCTDNSQCNSGEVCDTSAGKCGPCSNINQCDGGQACVAGACISDPKGLCAAHPFPCQFGCNSATGACLTQSGGSILSNQGVKNDPCSGDSDCIIGLACKTINTSRTCQDPNNNPPPITAPPAGTTGNLPSFVNITNPGPACFQGTCPTGLCALNGLCLPPSQYQSGLASSTSLTDFLLKLIKILLSFAGVVAVVMLVVGGYWYMGSGGNEELAEKGKKTVLNFVLGLAIIILAYTIVTVVSSTLTGADKLLQ